MDKLMNMLRILQPQVLCLLFQEKFPVKSL